MYKNLILILVLSSTILFAQQETIYELDEEIVVTASQIPTAFSDVARTISVLNRADIARLPVQSIADAIDYLSGVDMQQRGPNGVQSDVSIRGATFEQTLILIDGVKVSDSQTGHHNMNIPLTLEDIEKIEVLKGPGSKHFGPNALGGVINIITKFSEKKQVSLYESFGQHQFYDVGATVSLPLENIQTRFSIQKSATEGYRENTDFNGHNSSFASRISLNANWDADLLMGLSDKKFGANSFYSPNFPMQWEHTRTLFVKSGLGYKSGRYWYNTKFSFRRNDDTFMLDRDNPMFYQNQHQTNSTALEMHLGVHHILGITSFAAEYNLESISSNNLGQHKRNKSGLYLEHQFEQTWYRLIVGGSFYQVSDWGWNLWPGIDGRINFSRNMHLFASVGKAFRVPTFTELYYWDPANSGNADLKEESAWIYEAGFGYSNSGFRAQLSIFQRDSKQLIDWIWQDDKNYWQVQNVPEIRTTGLEVGLNFRPEIEKSPSFIQHLSIQYTYLNSVKDVQGSISKYTLSYLRHQFIAGLTHVVFYPHIQVAWKFRWEDRLLYDSRFLTDFRLKWTLELLQFNLDVVNLWDQEYEDYFNIPLPGRWIKFGIQMQVF